MTLMPLAPLRRLLTAHARAGDHSCQWCGAALEGEHRHVADLQARRFRCVCAGCEARLRTGAADLTRHRLVPRRFLRLPHDAISDPVWDAFDIPVSITFFFHNTELGRTVACYPGPAGATESLLPAGTWEATLQSNPWTRTLTPDVEALLVRRRPQGAECYVVPIDCCYELAGRIRTLWSGFGGGAEVQREIEAFFVELRGRSEEISG